MKEEKVKINLKDFSIVLFKPYHYGFLSELVNLCEKYADVQDYHWEIETEKAKK